MLVHHNLYAWVERGKVEQSFFYKETTGWQRPVSNHWPSSWKSNTLTIRPPCLHTDQGRGSAFHVGFAKDFQRGFQKTAEGCSSKLLQSLSYSSMWSLFLSNKKWMCQWICYFWKLLKAIFTTIEYGKTVTCFLSPSDPGTENKSNKQNIIIALSYGFQKLIWMLTLRKIWQFIHSYTCSYNSIR